MSTGPESRRPFGAGGRGSRVKFPVQTLEEYEALFEGAAGATAVGEATPHYLSLPEAAGRIHALLPAAKLIASLAAAMWTPARS